MDSLTTLGILLLYCTGLVLAYFKGVSDMKKRYTKIIQALHVRYHEEMSTSSDLLSDLHDIEEFYEYQEI